eukprot:4625229-Alexandrium_andersonii.AAC.1
MKCRATKGPGPMNFADVSDHAAHRASAQSRTFAEYLAAFAARDMPPPALARLPGITLESFKVDFMHTDLAPWIIANVLIEVCGEGLFGNFHA